MKLIQMISGMLAAAIAAGCLCYPVSVTSLNSVQDVYAATVLDLTFTENENSVTVTQCDHYASGTIQIPEEYMGKPVRKIAAKAFQGCSDLTSISMPNSITSIGESAFQGIDALKELTLSDNITAIPDYCFEGCKNLKSLSIPEKVSVIGQSAFAKCTALSSISISENIEVIGANAFSECTLNSISVQNPVLNITDALNGSTVKSIFGYVDSTAETYAKQEDIPFGVIAPKNTTTLAEVATTTLSTTTAFKAMTTAYSVVYTTMNYNTTTTVRYGTTAKATTKAATTVAAQNGLIKFDVNKDRNVTIADAVFLTRFVSEDETVVLPQNCDPDVNGDGIVSIADVTAVLNALQPFSVKIGKATAKPGAKVTLPVQLYADKGTAGGQIYLHYDTKLLTPVSVKSGDAYAMNFTAEENCYPLTIAWTSKTGRDQIAKNGSILAYLEFEVDPNIDSIEYLEIGVSSKDGPYVTNFVDSDGHSYSASYIPGYITVVP